MTASPLSPLVLSSRVLSLGAAWGPLEGLFWLQGESDSGAAKHANAYHDNLVAFVQAVRRDLDCPELPFVASQVVWPTGKKVAVVNAALDRLNDEASVLGPYAACVSCNNYTTSEEQQHHMDTPSVILAGERLCEAQRHLVSGRAVVRAADAAAAASFSEACSGSVRLPQAEGGATHGKRDL